MNDRHAISPYPIRMPVELRRRLEESAKAGSRSLHAEIISRLEESLDPQESAVEREYRLSQIREKASQPISNIVADFALQMEQEIERRARQIAEARGGAVYEVTEALRDKKK